MLFAGKMDLTEGALMLQAGRLYKFKKKKRRVKNGECKQKTNIYFGN